MKNINKLFLFFVLIIMLVPTVSDGSTLLTYINGYWTNENGELVDAGTIKDFNYVSYEPMTIEVNGFRTFAYSHGPVSGVPSQQPMPQLKAIPFDYLQHSNDAQVRTVSLTPVKAKEIHLTAGQLNLSDGINVRVKFTQFSDGVNGQVKTQIYVDGMPLGTLRTSTTQTQYTYSEDITSPCSGGCDIQLYTQSNNGYASYVKDFRIYYYPVEVHTEKYDAVNVV